jgi:hypothetical protein
MEYRQLQTSDFRDATAKPQPHDALLCSELPQSFVFWTLYFFIVFIKDQSRFIRESKVNSEVRIHISL